MALERTLSIVKPDGLEKGIIGKVVSRFEENGLKPVAMRMQWLSTKEAEGFYAVHKARPFFRDLVTFMTSGPCLPMALERSDAVATLRQVIGATDPAEAAPGTVRKLYAESKGRNAIHASDSDENARREVAFFFTEAELAGLWG